MTEEHGGDPASPSVTTTTEVVDGSPNNIKIKVSFGSNNFQVFITPQSTFGVKDNSKVILVENKPTENEDKPTENEDLEKAEEIKETVEEVSRGLEAVNRVREENNQFEEQVISLEAVVCSGTQVADKDFVFLTEMLMRQLLKLDGIDAEGEGRTQRRLEVRRVQGLVEKLDTLRAKNSDLTSNAPDEPSLPSSSSKVDQECELS